MPLRLLFSVLAWGLLAGGVRAGAPPAAIRRLPPTAEGLTVPRVDAAVLPAAVCPPLMPAADAWSPPEYGLDFVFDKGFGIVSTDRAARPNSLFVGARVQQRYTGFTRDEDAFADSTGARSPILNRNNFDFERVRLNFQGTALDPRLRFNLSIDGDSDGASTGDLLFYFFQFDADDALKVRVGRWRTLFGREWLLSSRYLRLADRSLATEFFRPTFSDGVWLLGDLPRGAHYEVGLTNGLATSTRAPFSLDDNLAVGGTLRWDLGGAYGKGFQDYGGHATPVARVGLSGLFSKTDDRSDAGFPLGDDSPALRLTDGTLLAAPGALAPGVSVFGVRTLQAAVDAGLKWRGWSVGGEYFVRSLQDFTADGPLPVTQITQRGYRAEAGVFLLPRRLDINFQTSQVTGPAGTGFTYSAGVNYYLRCGPGIDDRLNKLTLDVTDVTSSPETTSTADFIAGDDGQLFRLQVQLGF